MTSHPNLDSWKDELLARPDITQEEYHTFPAGWQLWMIENKHIFYNVNGGVILNLVHPKYKDMAKLLKVTARNRHNGTYWNTTDLPKK